MQLPKLAVRRPIAITVVVIIAILFGFISLQKIGIDLLPDLNFPVAVVVIPYPGSSARTIQQDVTIPVEGSLANVSGLRRIDSFSMANICAITLQFQWGTDMLSALDHIRNNLAQAALTLPDEVQTPVVAQVDPNDFPLMLVGVSGDDLTPIELSEELLEIKPQLEQILGVAEVSLLGTSKEEIQVLFDPEHLNEIGLTPVILQQLIMYQNIVVPGGTVTAENTRFSTRAGSEIKTVAELEDIIVGMEQGSGILGLGGMIPSLTYLSDVAEVSTHLQPRDGITRFNGEDTALIQIMRQSGANTVRVADNLRKTLHRLEAEYPHLQFTTITDQSLFIRNSISSLATSGLIGGFLAVAVLWFFLRNLPSLLIIALSIPVSIIASFVLVYFSNLSLNLMTLGGLALGIGMLVDSSIVVLENIYRHRTEGAAPQEAAENGAGEITGAITASTATTIAVFLPVIFLQSIAGQLFKELGLTISYSLLVSLLVALTLIPMLSAKFIRKKTRPALSSKKKPSLFRKVQRGYLRFLQLILDKKTIVLGAVVLLLIFSALIYPSLDQEFLPSFDEGFLGVTAMLPAGLPLEKVRTMITGIEDDLAAIPEIASVATQVGDQGEMNVLDLVAGTGIENAQFSITLIPHEQRKGSSSQIAEELQNMLTEHGALRVNIADSSLFGSAASTILAPNLLIEVRGEDVEVLLGLSKELIRELRQIPGFRDVQDSEFRRGQELFLNVDTSRSILGGFTAGQVGLGMRYATSGLKATDLQIGRRVLPVMLRPNSPVDSVDDLLNTKITSPVQIGGFGENPILLNEVVEPIVGPAPTVIQRTNRLPVIYVTGILGDLSLTKATQAAQKIIEKMAIPRGYHVNIGGMQEVIDESLDELGLALALAVALVYLVMAAQFESFLQPFIIMFSIPLALIGSLGGLWLVGGNIGIMAIIGIIVLAGIVVNNAIVLVDYINLKRKEAPQMPVRDAVLEACQVRLRPILMTSITTIFGLLPVALGFGVGSEFQRPLAATIMGGLATSTFLTLFVIPVIYELFHRLEKKEKTGQTRTI
ncbi:MAG: efflux RND transporter permease subunit [Firmicutes bacterium]|nr:efflux RND transporter permease subunit [Bacillota bacterium]